MPNSEHTHKNFLYRPIITRHIKYSRMRFIRFATHHTRLLHYTIVRNLHSNKRSAARGYANNDIEQAKCYLTKHSEGITKQRNESAVLRKTLISPLSNTIHSFMWNILTSFANNIQGCSAWIQVRTFQNTNRISSLTFLLTLLILIQQSSNNKRGVATVKKSGEDNLSCTTNRDSNQTNSISEKRKGIVKCVVLNLELIK